MNIRWKGMHLLWRIFWAASCFLGLIATGSFLARAGDEERASGQFDSNGTHLKIKDAYEFRAMPFPDGLSEEEEVIVVAVSNDGFIPAAIDEYWDRRYALDRFFKDESTLLVYFEFGLDGRYRGLSYYFGPGQGCGYCYDSAVQSTVRLKGGRLTGKLSYPKGNDPKFWFDVSLNVLVASDDHGVAQGPGGGEPGRAYMAYHRALYGEDEQAIRTLLSEEKLSQWARAAEKGNDKAFLAYLRKEHPQEVRVTEAYIRGDRSLVLLEGKGVMSSVYSVRGEAVLLRERGAWRFEKELLQIVVW